MKMAVAKSLIPVVCAGIFILLAWFAIDTRGNQTRYLVFSTKRWGVGGYPITYVEALRRSRSGTVEKQTPSFAWELGPVRITRIPKTGVDYVFTRN